MHIGDLTGLGSLAMLGGDEPRSLEEQVEYLFAKQLVAAMSQSQAEEASTDDYLALLSDHLAREMARSGILGIGRQLVSEVPS
ncbi:MAG: hypothetical protein RMK29_16690 [Myxococcales bacterium]|nr:hypothetical protein [Myxococcota bacterium]MDW8283346.1 hypothetical protein [Myxococcales bacterium]